MNANDLLPVTQIHSGIPVKTDGRTTLSNGGTIYWVNNKAGGRTYYSDEIGYGLFVWDTVLIDQATLLAVLAQEQFLINAEAQQEKNNEIISEGFWRTVKGVLELKRLQAQGLGVSPEANEINNTVDLLYSLLSEGEKKEVIEIVSGRSTFSSLLK